jgi:hypothetical protein
MLHPDKIKDLAVYYENEKFLIAVIEQLNKDAHPHFSLDLKSLENASDIAEILSKHLSVLDQDSHGDLISMLYRIDLSQDKFHLSMVTDNPYESLAKCILDRELKKVLFREFYKHRQI